MRIRIRDLARAGLRAVLTSGPGRRLDRHLRPASSPRLPLAVSYQITNRCNHRCDYCARWRHRVPELSADEAEALVTELGRGGTRFLQVTGGEPLLREDLDPLLGRAEALDLWVGLNTNGALLPQRPEILSRVRSVTISLDGPAPVHETARPRGSFAQAIAGLELAKRHGRQTRITATLGRHNLEAVDALLSLAAELQTPIRFQPGFHRALSGRRANPTAADAAAVRALFRRLLRMKQPRTGHGGARGRSRWIHNTALELAYLACWPERQHVPCAGPHLFARVEPTGDVRICGLYRPANWDTASPNVLRDGVGPAFQRLRPPRCDTCYCAARLRVNLAQGLCRFDARLWRQWLRVAASAPDPRPTAPTSRRSVSGP